MNLLKIGELLLASAEKFAKNMPPVPPSVPCNSTAGATENPCESDKNVFILLGILGGSIIMFGLGMIICCACSKKEGAIHSASPRVEPGYLLELGGGNHYGTIKNN